MPPREPPNTLLLFGLCFLVAVGFIGLLKLNHWWQTRGSVKDFEEEEEEAPAPRQPPTHMSSTERTPPRLIPAVPGTGTIQPLPSGTAPPDLTYDDAVRRVAAIRVNGKWWVSGKKLYSAVGGNHERFLQLVSEVRGETVPADVPPAALAPISGRALPAGAVFHSDDPELQYRELE